jgi:hypothetical protein
VHTYCRLFFFVREKKDVLSQSRKGVFSLRLPFAGRMQGLISLLLWEKKKLARKAAKPQRVFSLRL